MKPLVPSATANIKHSPIFSQSNIKSQAKCLFTLLPITRCMCRFQQKIRRHFKRQEKAQSEEKKKGSEQNFIMTQMLERSNMKFKIAKVEMWRGGIN